MVLGSYLNTIFLQILCKIKLLIPIYLNIEQRKLVFQQKHNENIEVFLGVSARRLSIFHD